MSASSGSVSSSYECLWNCVWLCGCLLSISASCLVGGSAFVHPMNVSEIVCGCECVCVWHCVCVAVFALQAHAHAQMIEQTLIKLPLSWQLCCVCILQKHIQTFYFIPPPQWQLLQGESCHIVSLSTNLTPNWTTPTSPRWCSATLPLELSVFHTVSDRD